MKNRSIILIVILFAATIAGMFTYAFLKQREVAATPSDSEVKTTEVETSYGDITRIDAKHYYIDGTHTVVGEVLVPTPCDLLESTARLADNDQSALLELTVLNNSSDCIQVVTPARFMASLEAADNLEWKATFMGKEVPINLIEAADGERPEDFELYLKG